MPANFGSKLHERQLNLYLDESGQLINVETHARLEQAAEEFWNG
jgi:hypothetical protein